MNPFPFSFWGRRSGSPQLLDWIGADLQALEEFDGTALGEGATVGFSTAEKFTGLASLRLSTFATVGNGLSDARAMVNIPSANNKSFKFRTLVKTAANGSPQITVGSRAFNGIAATLYTFTGSWYFQTVNSAVTTVTATTTAPILSLWYLVEIEIDVTDNLAKATLIELEGLQRTYTFNLNPAWTGIETFELVTIESVGRISGFTGAVYYQQIILATRGIDIGSGYAVRTRRPSSDVTAAPSGQALRFNGFVKGFLLDPTKESNFALSSFSVMFHFRRLSATSTGQIIICKYGEVSGATGWAVGISDSTAGRMKFFTGEGLVLGGDTLESLATVPIDDLNIHSCVCTFNGTTKAKQIFIDGQAAGAGVAVQGVGYTSTETSLGYLKASGAGTQRFNGDVDELIILDHVATSAEIAAYHNGGLGAYSSSAISGKVGMWHMDETSGQTITGAISGYVMTNQDAAGPTRTGKLSYDVGSSSWYPYGNGTGFFDRLNSSPLDGTNGARTSTSNSGAGNRLYLNLSALTVVTPSAGDVLGYALGFSVIDLGAGAGMVKVGTSGNGSDEVSSGVDPGITSATRARAHYRQVKRPASVSTVNAMPLFIQLTSGAANSTINIEELWMTAVTKATVT